MILTHPILFLSIITLLCGTALGLQTGATAANVSDGGHGMDEEALSQISEKLQAIVDSGQSSGMITMMFGGPPSGFDPASSGSACRESDSAEATVALVRIAAVISRRGKQCFCMSVNLDGF